MTSVHTPPSTTFPTLSASTLWTFLSRVQMLVLSPMTPSNEVPRQFGFNLVFQIPLYDCPAPLFCNYKFFRFALHLPTRSLMLHRQLSAAKTLG